MKKFIGILGVIIVIGIAVSFSFSKESYTREADFDIVVENHEVKKDEEVKVMVTVKSSVKMDKLEAYLNYDESGLEFIDANDDAVVGASGTLYINEEFSEPCDVVTYTITMKALSIGKFEIAIHDVYLEDYNNSDILEINTATATVTVVENEEESNDATLSELLIFPGELQFSSKVYEYEVNVDSDVEEFIISAIPANDNSTVTVSQPEMIQYGDNEIIITVTAQSGDSKIYTIHVYRKEK